MRAGALAAVSIVAACLGAAAVLLVGSAAGWIGGESGVRTVVVPAAPADDGPSAPTAAPLLGNGFDPARIYANRSEGVVTIYSFFSNGQRAQGSGFVVSAEGHILTNSHVVSTSGGGTSAVKGAEQLYVVFHDGDRVRGSIVGWDLFNDTGLVKVDPEDHAVAPVPLGDSSSVVVGEPVAAIGSPFGQESSLAVGVVSATERSIGSLTSPGYNLVDAIQTDAPINRGNSGGPMFNARGEVIGINAQIRSESGNAEGVGFAVPINAASRSMSQLVATGRVRYAWLGVTTRTVTPRLADRFGFGAERGAAIQEVVPGSPAAKAGLHGGGRAGLFEGVEFMAGGDLIVAVDGRAVETSEDVVRVVTQRLPGQRVRITFLRGDERRTVAIVLGERPATPPETGR